MSSLYGVGNYGVKDYSGPYRVDASARIDLAMTGSANIHASYSSNPAPLSVLMGVPVVEASLLMALAPAAPLLLECTTALDKTLMDFAVGGNVLATFTTSSVTWVVRAYTGSGIALLAMTTEGNPAVEFVVSELAEAFTLVASNSNVYSGPYWVPELASDVWTPEPPSGETIWTPEHVNPWRVNYG